MSDISTSLRDEVTLRADNRCEYCRLSQVGQEATFHIDHVIPRVLREGRRLPATWRWRASRVLCGNGLTKRLDPEVGEEVPLFNPRMQTWAEHFRWDGELVVPLTPTGRATVAALALNRPMIVAIRQEEAIRGRHPPV